jgi:hypothetical protein
MLRAASRLRAGACQQLDSGLFHFLTAAMYTCVMCISL